MNRTLKSAIFSMAGIAASGMAWINQINQIRRRWPARSLCKQSPQLVSLAMEPTAELADHLGAFHVEVKGLLH